MTIKLSICICGLPERRHLLAGLVDELWSHPRSSEIEILTRTDAGSVSLAEKRNALVASASGRFICHIDDDDWVVPRYLDAILERIDEDPTVDVITIRGERTSQTDTVAGLSAVKFDYRLGRDDGFDGGILWRSPGHLCPIRSDIAKSTPFPPLMGVGEDLIWSRELAPKLKHAVPAGKPGEILYHYRYTREKTTPALAKSTKGTMNDKDFGIVNYSKRAKPLSHQQIFTPQYKERSGPGSTAEFSQPYRKFLCDFMDQHKIKSVIDLGCGDMTIMGHPDMRQALCLREYRGMDVIEDRIRLNKEKFRGLPYMGFSQGDISSYQSFSFDLIICKDVLQHWSNAEVKRWVGRLVNTRTFRSALITNCNYGTTVNTDIETGGWRSLDLTKPPFEIGEVVFSWGKPNKDVVLIEGAK